MPRAKARERSAKGRRKGCFWEQGYWTTPTLLRACILWGTGASKEWKHRSGYCSLLTTTSNVNSNLSGAYLGIFRNGERVS